jgi:hypothetical protein
MAEQAKKAEVDEAAGKRWPRRDWGVRHSVDRLDYLIRRWVIPDHPANNDGAVATALPFRSSAPYLSWQLTRTLSNSAASGPSKPLLSDLQAAVGRALRTEYDLSPLPSRHVALLAELGETARP